MLALDEFQALQRKVENLKQERDQACGVIAASLERVARDHGCSDLKSAKRKRDQLRVQREEVYSAYLEALAEFESRLARVVEPPTPTPESR